MNDKVKIQITLSADVLKKLEEQLAALKSSNEPLPLGMHTAVDTIEDLVANYVEQITVANDDFSKIQEKMEDVYNVFAEKGIDVADLFANFGSKKKEAEPVKKPVMKKS